MGIGDFEFDILPKMIEEKRARSNCGYHDLKERYERLEEKLLLIYEKYPHIEKEVMAL